MIIDRSKVDAFYLSVVGKRVNVFLLNHKIVSGVFASFDDEGIIIRSVSGRETLVSRSGVEGVSIDTKSHATNSKKNPSSV